MGGGAQTEIEKCTCTCINTYGKSYIILLI